jgi:hypothetical protein
MPKQDLQFHAYVINLPNATQRWGEIRSNLEELDALYMVRIYLYLVFIRSSISA